MPSIATPPSDRAATLTTPRVRFAGWMIAAALAVGLTATPTARAGQMLTFNLETTVNGSTPKGTATAFVQDLADKVVRITLSLNLTAASEFVADWGFNLRSAFTDYAHLTFDPVSASNPANPLQVSAGAALKFDPAAVGPFNLIFDWKTKGSTSHEFGGTDNVAFDVTYTGQGSTPFSASLFNVANDPKGKGVPPIYSAVKIQGIPGGKKGDDDSTSGELGDVDGPKVVDIPITPTSLVPEPSTIVMGATACLIGLGAQFRRRGRRPA